LKNVRLYGLTIFRDLLVEALTGILSKPGRMALTIGGIVIGLTALVATIGLTNTAANSIISNFDELAATEITVTAKSSLVVEPDPETIPWDSSQKISELRGVVAAVIRQMQ
jgi:macrolide transport system ATP-binding/permease protein